MEDYKAPFIAAEIISAAMALLVDIESASRYRGHIIQQRTDELVREDNRHWLHYYPVNGGIEIPGTEDSNTTVILLLSRRGWSLLSIHKSWLLWPSDRLLGTRLNRRHQSFGCNLLQLLSGEGRFIRLWVILDQ